MTSKHSKRQRREAARRARQRRQRMTLGASILAIAMAVGVAAIVLVNRGTADGTPVSAPDFELTGPTGESVRLSDYRGRPVAVTFMHSW